VKNLEIGPGKIAVGNELLIYRPQSYDAEAENANFFQILDKYTLQASLKIDVNISKSLTKLLIQIAKLTLLIVYTLLISFLLEELSRILLNMCIITSANQSHSKARELHRHWALHNHCFLQ